MDSKIIFYGMGWRAGWFSLARVSESNSKWAVANIWALTEQGPPKRGLLAFRAGGLRAYVALCQARRLTYLSAF
jgi:hypothetical protein